MIKSVMEVWYRMHGDNRDNLVKACCEIQSWKSTGILSDGIVRDFVKELIAAEYPAHHAYAIAENHITSEAMSFVIENLS